MTTSCKIRISGLSKRFSDNVVLNDINLDLEPGERVAIIGPSGTGKSTLLRCLNFLDRPDAGLLTIGDLSVDATRASRAQILALRRRTGFVFQNYALFANKTARQNITEGLITVRRLPRRQAEARADEVLSRIGLSEKADSYPSALSGGQQQRVALARALAATATSSGARIMLSERASIMGARSSFAPSASASAARLKSLTARSGWAISRPLNRTVTLTLAPPASRSRARLIFERKSCSPIFMLNRTSRSSFRA